MHEKKVLDPDSKNWYEQNVKQICEIKNLYRKKLPLYDN